MDYISYNSLSMMEKSMDYLWTRQSAILDNIANAETPGYKAKTVSFEEKFKEQLERAGRSSSPKKAVRNVLESAKSKVLEQSVVSRMDDNGVDIGEQSVAMVENAYQLQYTMSAINSELSTLKIAIQG